MASLVHCVLEGAFVALQLRRRWHLAIKEVKAITSNSLVGYWVYSPGRPKIPMCGEVWKVFENTLDMALTLDGRAGVF